MIAIELSDAGKLALDTRNGALLQIDQGTALSPGYAVAQPNRMLTGQAARAASRLFPTRMENAFWDALNTEPLQRPLPLAGTNAELAFLHMQEVWKNLSRADQVVLAVPGFFRSEELGLLVGIAQELRIPVKGVVDLALAAPVASRPDRTLVHIDLHLHRATVSRLDQAARLSVAHTEITRHASWSGVHDAWVKWIADEFVQATRFDPLYSAETEQAVFNQLDYVVASLSAAEEMMFELPVGGQVHAVKLARERLLETSRPAVEAIAEALKSAGEVNGPMHLLLSHRAAGLPGLEDRLGMIPGTEVERLNAGASAAGAASITERMPAVLQNEGASLINERPWDAGSSLTTPEPVKIKADELATIPPTQEAGEPPSHVVYRGKAVVIGDDPVVIGRELNDGEHGITTGPTIKGVSRRHCTLRREGEQVLLEDHSRFGTYLDERKIHDCARPCEAGQVIRLVANGEELLLISLGSET